jgi:hypothetical protein
MVLRLKVSFAMESKSGGSKKKRHGTATREDVQGPDARQ